MILGEETRKDAVDMSPVATLPRGWPVADQ